ncbi:hypothetical protein [Streptomyces sp. NPDC001985]|uniref:hypothetical protein n=1 Tax=Streptomyces sp. NPDC001985 TaxID=3154406 RepID=UPI00332C6635
MSFRWKAAPGVAATLLAIVLSALFILFVPNGWLILLLTVGFVGFLAVCWFLSRLEYGSSHRRPREPRPPSPGDRAEGPRPPLH